VQLCKLLEADIVHSKVAERFLTDVATFDDTEHSAHGQGNDSRSSGYDINAGRSESYVSYDVFVGAYWPHFSQSLTKGLGELPS